MKPNKICKRSFIMAMVLAAIFALGAAWPRPAAAVGPAECSMIGTWSGDAGYSLRWLGVHTAGSTVTSGEMVLTWHRVSASLLNVYGLYPSATSLTGGRGVWEMTAKGKYNYTWYAYGMGATGYANSPIYSVRVSGTATNMAFESESLNLSACDYMLIDSTYEVFDGFVLPQDMLNPQDKDYAPVLVISTPVEQTRVPLTVVPPPVE